MSTSYSAASELWTSPNWVYSQRPHSWLPLGDRKTKSFHDWWPTYFTRETESKSEESRWNEKCSYSPDELVWQKALGPKALGLESHVLLGLGVERGVFDQRVHKHPDVVLHLKYKWEEGLVSFQHTSAMKPPQTVALEMLHQIIHNPTWKGLTDTPALFFFFTTSISLDTIWSTT